MRIFFIIPYYILLKLKPTKKYRNISKSVLISFNSIFAVLNIAFNVKK